MGRRALVGTVATLGLMALIGLFASLSLLFSSPDLVYAQTNNAPTFNEGETTTRSVDENTAAFHPFGDPVTATDADTDERLVYTLEDARTSPFTIVRATGQLQVGLPLDYETTPSYTEKVIVTDSDGATDTITVTINVNNVEEAGKVTLSWTKPQKDVAVEAILSDPDGTISGEPWLWERSGHRTKSGWSTISGTTSASYTPQAADVDKYLRVTASYTDGEASDKTAQAVSARWVKDNPATDNDLDTANHAPVFRVNTNSSYNCDDTEPKTFCLHLRKNDPIGKSIYYPVRATDEDQGDEIRYSLEESGSEHFNIEPTRGALSAKTLPRDLTDASYNFTIRASDQSGDSDTITVTITLSGSANNPTAVGPTRITYPENGTWQLATYTATNARGPISGWIIGVQTRSQGETRDGDFFDIDDEGRLTFTQPPDYENPADDNQDNEYSFSLHIWDSNPPQGQRPGQTFFNVTVIVTDETVEALEIDGPSADDYAENGDGPVGTYTLERLHAIVPVDEWVLSGADGDQFSITDVNEDNKWELTFKSSPDYENPTDIDGKNDYLVTITAYSGSDSKTEFIRVQVTDVNEPPEFEEGETATRSVASTAEVDDLFGDPILATDPDDEFLTYSLPDDNILPFSISPTTGQLWVDDDLIPNKDSYRVTVEVTDGADADSLHDGTKDDRIIVTVHVDGAGSNNAPEFPSGTVTFSIDENTATVQDVGTPVVATDDDNDVPTYTLGGTDAGFFTIVSTSGQIQTKTGQNYDFETKPSYSVTVTADDSNRGTADKAVTISLTNVEEDGTVTLSTNQPSARAQVTATLTDPDEVVSGTTTWQWERSNDGNANWTDVGTDSPSYTTVDGDVGYYLRATASYTDGHGANKNSEAKTASAVQSGTNRVPTFDDGLTTTREVAEGTEAGENAGVPVEASDLDNDTLTYSLTGTDAASFTIDTVDNTGQIKVGATTTLDYEAVKDSYTVIVRVQDNRDALGNTDTNVDATIVVTINVTDVEEAGTVTLSPTQPAARSAVTATLTDPDGSISGTSWQWQRSSDGNTGWANVGTNSDTYTPVDGDVTYYLRATASYTDGEASGKTAQAVSTSAVQTGTNRPPTFDDGQTTTRDVAEDAAAIANVGAVVGATDQDNDSLTYSLTSIDASSFTVDNTGQIKVGSTTTLDYESAKNTYTVVVQVTDSKDAAGDTETNPTTDDIITVTINVTDVDEDGTVSLSMTHPSARTQLTATLTDPDGGVTSESWQWAKADAKAGPYTDINGETSANYTPDNGDVNKVLKAKVSYTDDHGQNKRAEAVSDNAVQAGANRPPTFSSGTVTRTVAENSGADIDVGSPVTATDLDTGSTLIYTLEGTDHDSFHVLSDSGQIQTKQGVTYDYETKQTYSVTVKADDGNSGTATKAVTINVTDAEDAGTVTLSTSQPVARTQLTATLSDQDGPVTSTTWVWERMLDPDDLTTHPWATITGATTDSYTPIDGDVNYYLRATATYTDSHEPNKTAAAVSANAVQSGVNRAPAFSAATATREFPENTGPGLKVDIPVGATDVDANDVLEYTLEGTDKDFFEIVPTNGQIKTKEGVTYDHEDRGSYSVTVKVDDKSGGTDTIDVTINVTDVNEKPSFTVTESVAFSIAENTSANTNIGNPVAATDPDNGDTLTYSLSGTDADSFNINTSTGQLQTKAAPDFEDKPEYYLTVWVRDSRGDDGTADTTNDASIPVTISVTDVNEPPAFPSTEIGRRNVDENSLPGSNIGVPVGAIDPEGDSLTYTLDRDDEGLLSIDGATGQIRMADGVTLDHETTPSYTVIVSVSDSKDAHGNSDTITDDTVTVTITVADGDEPPVLTGQAAVSYPENGDGPVHTYTAIDPERATIKWSLKGDDVGDFSFKGGVLAFDGSPDYETPTDTGTNNQYSVTVVASDGPNPVERAVTVTVTNVNEPPAFLSGETGFRVVDENTATGQVIGDPVGATDPDDGDRLAYTLGGTDAASFAIVASTGQLQVNAALDYETKSNYSVTVSVSDGKDANGGVEATVDATIPVTIVVDDMNEPPEFDARTATRTIAENTAADRDIGNPFTAMDPDDYTLSYSLGGTDAAIFRINASTGQLQTRGPLDHETKSSYTVTVSVHDGKAIDGTPSQATDDTVTVTITVTDVEEDGTLTLSSVQPQVDTALTATLEDPDGSVTITTWLWESSSDKANWTIISGATGAAYTPAASDVDEHLRVTATYTDSRGQGKSASVTSDNPVRAAPSTNTAPTFSTGTTTRTIAENTEADEDIGTPVSASDSENDTLTYSLSGTDAASFGIVQATGQLLTKGALDFEAKDTYTVTVTATDPSGLFDTTTVTITVIDVNEAPSVTVTPTVYFVENGTGEVATYMAADPENATLTWKVTGVDSNTFSIDGGVLTFKTPPDYENPTDADTNNVYMVTVEASDGPNTDDLAVTITVTDVDEPPLAPGQPVVSEESADSVSVTWTAPANDGRPAITGYDYQYKKTDEQSWSGATYAIPGDFTNLYITRLDASTSYDVQARAKNDEGTGLWSATGAGSTGNTTPAFSNSAVTRDVAENTPAGINIGYPVAATDDDNGDSLTYTLGGADAAAFDIDSKTGQLKTKALLDREAAKNTYTVIVTATDSADATDEATVTITVTDVNELPAFLPGETGFRVVNENTDSGQYIGVPVGANDPDSSDRLAYTLGGTNAASFAIVASTGQLQTNAALDYETKSNYSVTVSVSDGKDAEGIIDTTADATIPVTIVVDDVNEPPKFDAGTTTRTIAENTAADTNIGAPVRATDPDDYTLSYSLGGTDAAIFRINASTGQLQTRGPLDHETKSSYTVTVSVHDGKAIDGTPSQATDDTVTVTITVTDVEEDGTLTLSSVQPQVDTALTATLEDPDGSVTITTWLWESSSDKANWTTISGATGAAYTPAASDVDEHLRVTATYTDSRGQGKSASVTSDNPVRAAPPSNAAPTFSGTSTARSVEENTVPGANIGTPVTATDSNTDKLTYSLGGTDAGFFDIDRTSGQLLTKAPLDYEDKKTYSVTVTATDPSGLSDTIEVTITVTDVNEAPAVTVITPTVYFVENASGPVATYGATDPDGDTVMWDLATGSDSDAFSISSTGVLTFKTPPDYENPVDADTNNVYMVTVEASDGPKTDDLAVTITVTDVDEPPLAPGQPVVSEESASSVSVTWTAPANDGRPAITGYDYQYKKTDEQSWSSATYATDGVVTSITITGLDSSTSYEVQARAKNDEGTSPWSATGAGSTGNTTPDFSNSAVPREVAENTPANVNIGYPVTATDDDNGDSLTYTLGGTDATSFDIDSKTGQLKTKADVTYDHETDDTYMVIVTATDSASATAEATVTITVTNVNEPPYFGSGAANRTVAENTPPGDPVGLPVSAKDDDAGDTLTYSMGGADSASFGIDNGTGLITVGAGTRLDFEDGTKTTYEVTVTATDSSYLSATITVTIEVLNVDEDGVVTLSQLQPQVDTDLRASLDDPDGMVSGLTWKWEISSDNTNWDAIAGATLFSYTPVASDLNKFLRVTASYSDGEGANKTAQAAAPNPVQDVPLTNAVPVLPSQLPALTVAENTVAGENVGAPVTATDANNDTLTYKLSGVDAPSFSIVADSGQIQTKAPLDHESKDTYTVTVTATDPSDESDFVTVTITVTDLNEPPLEPGIPAMTQNTQTSLTMAWTAPGSTGRPPVTDYDYQYKKTAENTWTEVTNTAITGASAVINGLETTTSYHVQVRATNDEGTGDWSDSGIGVTRTQPNTPPEFPGPTTERHVTETAEERQNVGNPVDARDTDNDPLTYILEGTDANSFMIDDESGQLKTKMPLDHEVKDSYSVLVKAEDGRGGSDAISVTITVTNVNEPPEFSGNLGVHSVPENTAPDVNIGAPVAATDPENDPLTYSLDSAGAHAFDIDASTGQLRTKAVLDYETARTHSVKVHVSDRKNAQGATDTAVDDDISVTITVTNVNEPPAFTEAAPSRSVPENSGIGTDVGYPVMATDPDGDTLTYSLDGTDKDFFSINTSSGQLQTKTELDYESGKRSYTVTITAIDPSGESATVTMTIAVTDENEAPEVTISSTVRYAESGTDPVDTYTATDPERGTITWTLSGTDMDDFRISKINDKGVLEFRTPPNYEAPADADTDNIYLVTVEVSDGNTSDALQVTVTVFNVNEPPAFPAETGNRSVVENTAAGQNLGDAVAAADPERGDTLTYKLAGPDAVSFIINRATGQLRTRAPLDFETKRTYLVTVHVRDSKDQDDRVNAVTDDTINITITINNIDEDGWIVLSSRQPQIDTPFRATIEDPDGGVTSTIWKWESSPNKSTWTVISGQTSASYTPLTADGGKYLRVTASYTDGHGANKNAQKVSDNPVRVTPDSNVAPAFASNTATRSVDEGTAAGQNIGDPVSATDADPADGSLLTYSLTGPDAASFEIVRATGQLLTKAPLDHEEEDTYTVRVMVVDPSLLPAFISVTITVNDVDEPLVLSGPDVVDYPENGTDEVAQYTADDPEDVATIIWSLDGDDKDLFDITGGELTFKSSPDHDVAGDADGNNVYLVTVTASDGTTPVTLAMEVTVSNVNEAPEFPASETGDRTVAENTAADENIGDPVAATDPDSGDTLTYTLGGSDAGSFAIDETTGQLKTKDTLNYEAKDTYTVTVTATDSSGLSDTITVTVTVSSVNEVPEFTDGATASRSVDENTPAEQDIGAAVGATDPDTGDTLTYTLEGDDAASFAIDGASGQLKTRDPLDYETKASYSVTVSVSDGKDIDGNADTSADNTIDVTITVTNLAEAGKVILSSLQPQVGTPLTATLVDPDDATNVNWTWESSSNWSSGWTPISNATSDTYTPVTGDLNKYLRATATYTNSASAQVSAHGVSAYPVRAAPAPGSNAAPAFATSTATRSIPEDTPVGSAVGDPVTATDTNADDVLTYSLSGADAASFTIGMASGQLRTKAALDHDTKASYMVVVTAADPSGLSDTITVTISVTDQNEPPVISGKASVYYAEDRTIAVASYTATDPENGSITWSLAGEDSGDFSISNTGVLTFNTPPDSENPADADTNNVYLVTVQASDGTNTSALDVTVTVTDEADPPPAPDAPTVEAAATDGHTALSVSWQAPATTGGSPISDYEVEYGKQGSDDWSSENVTITGVTAAITSVLPDTLYEVRVRAENADGWGAWSEPGTGRTEVTPLGQQVDLTVSYQAAGYTVNEGATRAVSVTLSEAADRALQIPITVAPVTAESSDYQVIGLTGGALSFVPGDSTKSFTFEGLQDTDTSDETVTLGLGQLPDKVTAGTRSTAVVTIDDDDPVSSSRRRSGGGSGGGGGGGGGNYGSSSPGNKAPVFTEGDSATRSVAENTAAGVNIGTPVTATDADRDMLTYTVGGDDGSAFSVDGATGQLKTKSALDFETKSSYRVTMGVFDPSGGSDTITVTITVTDVADVPLTSGTTQMIGVVDSEQDTTVSTLDGSVAVTFPSGSRSGDYQVRLDYGVTNCNANFSGEELWFCLTVDIFDNAGNLEQGVVLSQPTTIKITRNGDERGGVDAVLGLHAQEGVSVYTRGRTGGEWTESEFTLESDGVGGIVITITGVSSFGLYAGTTDSSVPGQVSHQVATVPVPTVTPQNTGGQGSSPEPTPTPTPTPQPGSSPEQSTTPDPTPTPAPVVTRGTNPTPEPTLGHQVSAPFGPLGGPAATPTPAPPTPVGIAKGFGNLASAPPPDGDSVPTAEPEVKVASFDSEGGKSGGMPSWYVAMIMLALAATIAGGSTYFVKRRQRLPYPVTVQRSREFNKWWSGW